MATAYKTLLVIRRLLLVALLFAAWLAIFMTFRLNPNVAGGKRSLTIFNSKIGFTKKRDEHAATVDVRASNGREGNSWPKSTNEISSSGEYEDDKKKTARLVNRIMQVESVLHNHMSQGIPPDPEYLRHLELLITHVKLVKTLLEKSVFLVKLADLASSRSTYERQSSDFRGRKSSTWVGWEHLEPAIRELEDNMKSLSLQRERALFLKQRTPLLEIVYLLVLSLGLVFYILTLVRQARKGSDCSLTQHFE